MVSKRNGILEHPVASAAEADFEAAYVVRPSKSQLKRETDARRELGGELVALSPGKWAKLEVPSDLRAAVDEARRLNSHGAKKRQLRFIGGILDSCDVLSLRACLKGIDHTR